MKARDVARVFRKLEGERRENARKAGGDRKPLEKEADLLAKIAWEFERVATHLELGYSLDTYFDGGS